MQGHPKGLLVASISPRADSLLPFRSSKRITVTLPQSTLEALNERSSQEGRSLCNLVAFLLESALKGRTL